MPKPLAVAVILAALLTLLVALSPQAKAEAYQHRPWTFYLVVRTDDGYAWKSSDAPYATRGLCGQARAAEVARAGAAGLSVVRSWCWADGVRA